MNAKNRPRHLLVVAGTGTEIGKTWAACEILSRARASGLHVAARKPAQSFEPDDTEPTDAEQLAAASGETAEQICPPHRCYPRAMAPPMAADALGHEPLTLASLLAEIHWQPDTDLGLVETAGGIASPITHDADNAELTRRLAPDEVLLVADAGLGTINSVRLTVAALAPLPVTVFLNRFDPENELHQRNLDWLTRHDGLTLLSLIDQYSPQRAKRNTE